MKHWKFVLLILGAVALGIVLALLWRQIYPPAPRSDCIEGTLFTRCNTIP